MSCDDSRSPTKQLTWEESGGTEGGKVGSFIHSGLMLLLRAVSSQAFHWSNQPEAILASLLG